MILKRHTWRTDEYSADPSPSSETSPKIPNHPQERDKNLKTKEPACTLPQGSSLAHSLSPLLPSTSLPRGTCLLNSRSSNSLSQASPLTLSPRPPFLSLPSELRQLSLGSFVASKHFLVSLSPTLIKAFS